MKVNMPVPWILWVIFHLTSVENRWFMIRCRENGGHVKHCLYGKILFTPVIRKTSSWTSWLESQGCGKSRICEKHLGIKNRLKSSRLHLNQNPSNDMQIMFSTNVIFQQKMFIGVWPSNFLIQKIIPKQVKTIKNSPMFSINFGTSPPEIHGEDVVVLFFFPVEAEHFPDTTRCNQHTAVISGISFYLAMDDWPPQTHKWKIVSGISIYPVCFGNTSA